LARISLQIGHAAWMVYLIPLLIRSRQQSVEGEYKIVYECPRCEHRVLTRVIGLGVGDQGRAAREDALESAHEALDALPCPGCRRRRGWRRTFLRSISQWYVLTSIPVLLTSAWVAAGFFGGLGITAGLLGLAGVVLTAIRASGLARRVELISDPLPAHGPQVVGFACAVCAAKIMVDADGQVCGCGRAVHLRCAGVHGCDQKGEPARP
jgi:hypothetical protein